jgi:hypothetical protein
VFYLLRLRRLRHAGGAAAGPVEVAA